MHRLMNKTTLPLLTLGQKSEKIGHIYSLHGSKGTFCMDK